MSLITFVSLVTVPVTLLSAAAMLFVGVAVATKKNRLETVRTIQSQGFGVNHFSTFAALWAQYFHRLFGDRILAKRQWLTIPIYTLAVSGIFFLTWIVYLYIFQNSWNSFSLNLPVNFKQAMSDFYRKGIFAALLIDFVTIQLTKAAIRTGRKWGYCSVRFFLMFWGTLAAAYFIFSVAVLYFRVEDMVYLYVNLAPNDPIPVIPYAPLATMASSLSLFHPQTTLHVTTQGTFSSYFMPEPLIFYCAIAAQASLLFIALASQIAAGLEWLKNLCIGVVKNIGTPQANAYSIIVFIIIGLASIPIIALSVLAMLSGQ